MWPHIARWLMTLALGILVTPLAAHAQLAGKVPRIGIVGIGDPYWGVFRHTLRDLGYVAGQNLLLEHRLVYGQYDKLPGVLAELIGLKVDVIVTGFIGATLAAREATSTIPIIFTAAPNPVALGLVASLAHPGGNLTGVANMDQESIAYKCIELLKEVVPEATRLVFLANPDYPPYQSAVKALQAATASLGLQLRLLEVRHLPDDLEEAFAAIAREPPHALFKFDKPFRILIFKCTSMAFCLSIRSILGEQHMNFCKSPRRQLCSVLHHLRELTRLEHAKLPFQDYPLLLQQTHQFLHC